MTSVYVSSGNAKTEKTELLLFTFTQSLLQMNSTTKIKPFSLSLQPLTAFAELSYGMGDFAKTEGRTTEKKMMERVAEKNNDQKKTKQKKPLYFPERRHLARRITKQK